MINNIENWLQILMPFFSGLSGIFFALAFLMGRFKKLSKKNEDALLDNKTIKKELEEIKQENRELNFKIGFLIENAKEKNNEKKK